MDFKQLEAFISVAKNRSFSKAAEYIFLSQPTVSAHISALEHELKTSLFDRLGKEVRLTPAGQVFYAYAMDILNARDQAVDSVIGLDSKIAGELYISSSTMPCRCILPGIIKEFSKLYPNVVYKISGKGSGEVISRILNFQDEIGIVGECILDDRLVYDEIADDNLVVITPVNDRFQEMSEGHIEFHALLSEYFILRESGSATRQIFESALISAGHNTNRLKVLCEVESMDAALQFVKNGLGITVISESAAREYIDSHLVKKFYISDLELKRKIYMVRYSKKTLSPAANAFKTFITSSMKDKRA